MQPNAWPEDMPLGSRLPCSTLQLLTDLGAQTLLKWRAMEKASVFTLFSGSSWMSINPVLARNPLKQHAS